MMNTVAKTFLYGVTICVASSLVHASNDRETLGKVYDILEEDALEEIERRVASTPFDPKVFGEEDDWSALRSPVLPEAEETRSRSIVPFFSLSFDIPDKDGNVLYPKGYTFNPLEYMTLPQRLIVVNESQLDWAFSVHETGDMILLSGGNPLKAFRQHNRPIFKLEEQIRDRFDLQVVPSIVRQVGKKMVIEEFDLQKEPKDG